MFLRLRRIDVKVTLTPAPVKATLTAATKIGDLKLEVVTAGRWV
jgi:hypothetical protein